MPIVGANDPKLTEAEGEVMLEKQLNTAHELSNSTRDMAPIARGYAQDLEGLKQLLGQEVSPSKVVFGSLNAALGAYTGERKFIADDGKETLDETRNLWSRYNGLQKFVHQRQVHAIQLADLFPRFSGVTTNTPFLSCSFTELQAGFFTLSLDKWFLTMTNVANADLHNCVVAVRFSNDTGESMLQHYFVSTWAKEETRAVEYCQSDFPTSIVSDVSRVEVTIWSKEYSAAPSVIKKPTSGWFSQN